MQKKSLFSAFRWFALSKGWFGLFGGCQPQILFFWNFFSIKFQNRFGGPEHPFYPFSAPPTRICTTFVHLVQCPLRNSIFGAVASPFLHCRNGMKKFLHCYFCKKTWRVYAHVIAVAHMPNTWSSNSWAIFSAKLLVSFNKTCIILPENCARWQYQSSLTYTCIPLQTNEALVTTGATLFCKRQQINPIVLCHNTLQGSNTPTFYIQWRPIWIGLIQRSTVKDSSDFYCIKKRVIDRLWAYQ